MNIPVQICLGKILPVELENKLTKHIAQLRSREQQHGTTLDATLLGIGCACRAVAWNEKLQLVLPSNIFGYMKGVEALGNACPRTPTPEVVSCAIASDSSRVQLRGKQVPSVRSAA